MDIQISHDEGRRFVATVDGEHAGILDYRLDGDVATMPHTLVEPQFEGKGVGAALVQAAVDAARERRWSIVPACWYVAKWIDRHPDSQDLVAARG